MPLVAGSKKPVVTDRVRFERAIRPHDADIFMGMRRETLHRKVCVALKNWLSGESKLLFAAVAYKADEIAEGLGRKSELFSSLFDYERVLPADCAPGGSATTTAA